MSQLAEDSDSLLPVVGASMRPLIERLLVFSQHSETILIWGETGTGKSRLAEWCHMHSPRTAKTLVTVDLNTIPEEMQCAELFGWRKGAFTGSTSNSPGLIAQSDGGTLFLDEVDKLSLKAQAGLLRFLETRRYRILGEHKQEQLADVRIIVGVSKDLKVEVQKGRFREDLFYRIHVLPFFVPPLRERRDEISTWTQFMLQRRMTETGLKFPVSVQSGALNCLCCYDWPGNLRQLDNVVRRIFALSMIGRSTTFALQIEESHVVQALGMESGSEPRSEMTAVLQHAATLFVDKALKSKNGSPRLDLDLTQGFKGFVLQEAIKRTGSERDALLLFGKEKTVQGRNHTKEIRREAQRMNALCEIFR